MPLISDSLDDVLRKIDIALQDFVSEMSSPARNEKSIVDTDPKCNGTSTPSMNCPIANFRATGYLSFTLDAHGEDVDKESFHVFSIALEFKGARLYANATDSQRKLLMNIESSGLIYDKMDNGEILAYSTTSRSLEYGYFLDTG